MEKMAYLLKTFMLAILLSGCHSVNAIDSYGMKELSHTAVIAADRMDSSGWSQRHEAIIARVTQGDVDLIFVGDSITQQWETTGKNIWNEYYGRRKAVNLGFSGDRTQHVLWRLDNGEIDGINPKLAIVMIGTNNSNYQDYTAAEIADGIKAVCSKIRTKLPKTKILLLAIFPRGDAVQRNSRATNAVFNSQWAKNNNASLQASKIADGRTIHFLDINQSFLNSAGEITSEVMPDLLHLSENGYRIWARSIEEFVSKLLQE